MSKIEYVPAEQVDVPIIHWSGDAATAHGYTDDTRVMMNPVFSVWQKMGVIPKDFKYGIVILPDRPSGEDLLDASWQIGGEGWRIVGGGSLLKGPINKAWIGNMSIGLPDSKICPGLHKYDKDWNRVSRENAEGRAGCGFAEELEVEFVPDGEVRGGLPFNDGIGYARKSYADAVRHKKQKQVKFRGYGSARCTHTVTAMLPIDDQVMEEAEDLLLESYVAISNGKITQDNVQYIPDKGYLLDADELMARHPYLTEAMSNRMMDMVARVGFNFPLTKLKARIAVPALVKDVAIRERVVAYRLPQDKRNLVRVVEGGADQKEIDRVAKMEVVQYTLLAPNILVTGLLGILDDDDYDRRFGKDAPDLMIDAECAKLLVGDLGELRKRGGRMTLRNAVFAALMWYAAGSAIGVDAEWWKAVGGDFDGDLIFLAQILKGMERLVERIKAMPIGVTTKLGKIKRLLEGNPDAWGEALAECTLPIVETATNLLMTIVAMKPEMQEKVAHQAGYATAEALISFLEEAVRCGTDIFKAGLTEKVMLASGKEIFVHKSGWQLDKELAIIMTAVRKATDKVVPSSAVWCRAERAELFMNTAKIPNVMGHPGDWKLLMGLKPERAGIDIPGWIFKDSPVLRCYEHFRANAGIKEILGLFAESYPLIFYRDWAPVVRSEAMEAAIAVKGAYNIVCGQTNFSDSRDTKTLVAATMANLEREARRTRPEGMTKDAWYLECSYALWRVAHSAEGKRAGAGVAFNGLTDEMILHIIESKPGAKEDGEVEVVVVGLQYNLEVPSQLHRWAGEIEVVEAKIKGEPRNAVLPVDTSGFRYTGGWAPVLSMVGTISSRGKAGWAETGLYEARFRMINETSAIARLVPLP